MVGLAHGGLVGLGHLAAVEHADGARGARDGDHGGVPAAQLVGGDLRLDGLGACGQVAVASGGAQRGVDPAGQRLAVGQPAAGPGLGDPHALDADAEARVGGRAVGRLGQSGHEPVDRGPLDPDRQGDVRVHAAALELTPSAGDEAVAASFRGGLHGGAGHVHLHAGAARVQRVRLAVQGHHDRRQRRVGDPPLEPGLGLGHGQAADVDALDGHALCDPVTRLLVGPRQGAHGATGAEQAQQHGESEDTAEHQTSDRRRRWSDEGR